MGEIMYTTVAGISIFFFHFSSCALICLAEQSVTELLLSQARSLAYSRCSADNAADNSQLLPTVQDTRQQLGPQSPTDDFNTGQQPTHYM